VLPNSPNVSFQTLEVTQSVFRGCAIIVVWRFIASRGRVTGRFFACQVNPTNILRRAKVGRRQLKNREKGEISPNQNSAEKDFGFFSSRISDGQAGTVHINWRLGANSFGFLALVIHTRCVETQFQRASRPAKYKVSRDSSRIPNPG
jgi:hypothetical protein